MSDCVAGVVVLDDVASRRHHPRMIRALLSSLLLLSVLACDDPAPEGEGEGEGEGESGEGEGEGEGEAGVDDLDGEDDDRAVDDDIFPCDELARWPFSVVSTKHPLRVHFRARDEQRVARTLTGFLDEAWDVQVGTLGMPAPYTDDFSPTSAACAQDGRIDVFMIKGLEGAYVDVVASIEDTPIDDYSPYMVIDPFGVYGGEYLRPTAFHEFHHMTQAALDWSDTTNVYEMSATFVEEVIADDRDWEFTLVDLVDHVDWSVDRDDGYETNFMYAQALYLIFLQHHFFDGDVDFFVAMWRGLAGAPNYQDALNVLLAPHGTSFAETVPLYARWLAYLGVDDDEHFPRGVDYPAIPRQPVDTGLVTVSPMVLGSAYLELQTTTLVSLDNTLPAGFAVVVQQVPGAAADGDVLTLPATVLAGKSLVVTVVPTGVYDIADRTDDAIDVRLRFTP